MAKRMLGAAMKACAGMAAITVFVPTSQAQVSYTWTGAASGQWAIPANWAPAGIPGPLDAVLIQAAPQAPVMDGPRTIANVSIVSGQLDLAGHTLSVTGNGSYSGGAIIQGSLVLNAPGGTHAFNGALIGVTVSGTASSITFNGSTFQQPVTLTRTGPGNDICTGATIFLQPASLVQAGTGVWSLAHIGTTRFEGGLQVSSTGTGSIQFGGSGGSTLLPGGQTVSVGPLGFASGQLQFRNFVQQGSSPQTLSLSGSAQLSFLPGCHFEAALTATSPRLFLSGGTYFGPTSFTKVGGGSDNGTGGCTYHGPVILRVTGAGSLNPAFSGADVYNAGLNVACTGSGSIQFGLGGGTTTIPAGQSIGTGPLGFTNGLLHLSRVVQFGSATQNLVLSPSAALRFVGPNTFHGPVSATAGRLFVNGSTFLGPVQLTKTGALVDASTGGNVFQGPVGIGLSGPGELHLHATGTDQFQANITFSCTGTGAIRLGASSGTGVLAPGASMASHPADFIAGVLELRGTTQSGSASQSLSLGGTARVIIGQGCSFEGTVDLVAPSVLLNGGTFLSPLRVVKTGGGVDASTGGNTFVGTTDLKVTGTGALWLHSTGTDSFQGDVRVSAVDAGGIFFGMMGGSSTLANGRTIAVGAAGFNAGVLSFRNFQQIGPTPQTFILTGTALLRFDQGSSFGGDVNSNSPGLLLDGTQFLGAFDAVRTASVVNVSRGGNTFHGSFRLRQMGSGDLFLAQLQPDTFLGPVWFQRMGTGALHVAYSHNARFADDVSLDGTLLPITFGSNGGVVEVIGTGIRDWSSSASFPFQLASLRMNGAGARVQLYADVIVNQTIAFQQGVLAPMAATSMSTGLLVLQPTCVVSDPADDNSYADGWVRRIGATAFSFPLGNGGAAAPLAISAPAGPAEHFTARYRRADPDPNWDTDLKEPTLDHLSECEYWEVDRTNGSSPVVVTLSWGTPRSCGVDWTADLRVARWDGTLWRDLGQGSAIGTFASGVISSASATMALGPFTLASSSLMNPLPVELLRFEATNDGDRVRLEWATAQEVGSAAFEVERSSDNEHYLPVAHVMAVGNSQMEQAYVAYDTRPLNGLAYYRLKMIDLDGSYEYGPVRALQRHAKESFTVFPNPADDRIWLQMEAEGGEVAEVLDMTGSVVARIPVRTGPQGAWCPVGGLSAGVYLIRIVQAGRIPLSARFMKR